MKAILKTSGALAAALGFASVSYAVPYTVSTVGAVNASPTPTGLIIGDAASNASSGFVNLSTFTSDISTAYSANKGGVFTSETSSDAGTGYAADGTNKAIGAANTITLKYGASQANSVGFYIDQTYTAGGAFSSNTNNGATTSGSAYFGFGAGQLEQVDFTSNLSEVGITMVARAAARYVTLAAVLDDGSLLTSTEETTNLANTTGTTPGAIFFGFKPTVASGHTIVALRVVRSQDAANGGGAVQYARYDDLAFVVAPTPEPASLGLLAFGAVGLLRRRRSC